MAGHACITHKKKMQEEKPGKIANKLNPTFFHHHRKIVIVVEKIVKKSLDQRMIYNHRPSENSVVDVMVDVLCPPDPSNFKLPVGLLPPEVSYDSRCRIERQVQ